MFTSASPRKFLITLLIPVVLVMLGTLGYQFLEGLNVADAMYLTIMTLTTVGYGDIVPHTQAGRFFTMALVLSGVFTFFYAATAVIRVMVSGELGKFLGKKQMERTMAQLRDHVIVCGYARMEDAKSESKLIRAGANRVVSPYQIGGTRVAHAVLRPTVMDFVELATRTEHIDLQLEEARIAPESPLAGQNLNDSRIRAKLK